MLKHKLLSATECSELRSSPHVFASTVMWRYLFLSVCSLTLWGLCTGAKTLWRHQGSTPQGVSIAGLPGDNKVFNWTMDPVPPSSSKVTVLHPSGGVLFSALGTAVLPQTPLGDRVTNTDNTNTVTGHIEFTLTGITVGDAGDYRTESNQQVSKVGLTLAIYGKPNKTTITVEAEPEVDKTMILNCSTMSTSKPIGHTLEMNYTWYINDQELPSGDRYSVLGSMFNMKNIKKVDTNTRIKCKAYESPARLSDDSDTYNLIAKYRPSEVVINSTGLSYTLVENKETLGPISCRADCEPGCEYQWTFRDKPESSWSNVTNTNIDSKGSLILRVDNIKRTSAGEYRCKAKNEYGQKRSEEIEVTVNYGPDSVTLNPDTVLYTPLENRDTLGPITCSSVCNPPCLYQWLLDGSVVRSTSSLTITDIKRSASGTYQCKVTNKASSVSVTSAEIKVSVEYQPEQLVLDPIDLQYNVSENNRLGPIRCSATCYPPCQYQWMQNGVVKTQKAVLDIAQIKRSDKGIYVCEAENKRGVIKSPNIDIKVQYGPSNVTMTPDTVSYTQLENRDTLGPITCSTICYPECSYQWLRDGSVVGTTQTLTITNITRSATGIYVCRVNNTVGSRNSTQVNVSVEYQPEKPILNPSELQYTLLENYKLGPIHCSATCNPPCLYRWMFRNMNKTEDPVISIEKIQRSDNGTYVCVAWNKRGNIESSNVVIEVQYAPDIPTLVKSTQGDTMENQTVSLTCTTDSFPLPKISIVSLDTTRKNVSSSGKRKNTLTISKAECEDTGQYRCTATNDIGTSTSDSVTVNVMCAPHPDSRSVTHDIVYIGDEDSLNITGTVIANPRPALSWMFNSSYKDNITITTLHNSSDGFKYFERFHHVLYTSQAVKSTFHSKDYGQYILKANNSLGETKITFNVIAKRSPYPPYNGSVVCTGVSSATVTWISNFNGGDEQHFLVNSSKQSAKKFITRTVYEKGISDEYVEVFDNLEPGTLYVFSVKALNKNGESLLSGPLNCSTHAKAPLVPDSPDTGGIVGAVLGALIGIIVIGGVLIALLYRKRRKKQKCVSMQLEITASKPSDFPEDTTQNSHDAREPLMGDDVDSGIQPDKASSLHHNLSHKKDDDGLIYIGVEILDTGNGEDKSPYDNYLNDEDDDEDDDEDYDDDDESDDGWYM